MVDAIARNKFVARNQRNLNDNDDNEDNQDTMMTMRTMMTMKTMMTMTLREQPEGAILVICDVSDTDHISNN